MTDPKPPSVPARSISSARTARSREAKSGRLTLAESIAQQIDWTPTCLPGTERATIVRQVLDLDEIASDDDYWHRISVLSCTDTSLLARVEWALFGTTDGELVEDDAELPVGELRRLLRTALSEPSVIAAAEPSGDTVQAPTAEIAGWDGPA